MESIYEFIKSNAALNSVHAWQEADLVIHESGQVVENMVRHSYEIWAGEWFTATVGKEDERVESINIKRI